MSDKPPSSCPSLPARASRERTSRQVAGRGKVQIEQAGHPQHLRREIDSVTWTEEAQPTPWYLGQHREWRTAAENSCAAGTTSGPAAKSPNWRLRLAWACYLKPQSSGADRGGGPLNLLWSRPRPSSVLSMLAEWYARLRRSLQNAALPCNPDHHRHLSHDDGGNRSHGEPRLFHHDVTKTAGHLVVDQHRRATHHHRSHAISATNAYRGTCMLIDH